MTVGYVPPNYSVPQVSPYVYEVRSGTGYRLDVDLDKEVRPNHDIRHTMFNMNMSYRGTQNTMLAPGSTQMIDGTEAALACEHFDNVWWRYSGGNQAHGFVYDEYLGPLAGRSLHGSYFNPGSTNQVRFGPEEWVKWNQDACGKALFWVLNLVSLNSVDVTALDSPAAMAAHNAGLMNWLSSQGMYDSCIFQLSNEVLRSKHQWTNAEYVSRSLATINAMSAGDPFIDYIVHLHKFNYTYGSTGTPFNPGVAGPAGTTMPWTQVFNEVFAGLPMVDDYGLFSYYDTPQFGNYKYWVPLEADRVQDTINHFENVVRPGQTARTHLVEHSRRRDLGGNLGVLDNQVLTGMGGLISTADWMITMMQMYQVLTLTYHGANAGPWNLFDRNVQFNDGRLTPVGEGLCMLRRCCTDTVVESITTSQNASGYPGGYDVRAVTFKENDGSIKIWAINRDTQPRQMLVDVAQWNSETLNIEQGSIHADPGLDPDTVDLIPNYDQALTTLSKQTSDPEFALDLPASSVNVFHIDITCPSNGITFLTK